MSESNKLLVVWSSADREVALHNVFMYTHNAVKRGWWDEVRLLLPRFLQHLAKRGQDPFLQIALPRLRGLAAVGIDPRQVQGRHFAIAAAKLKLPADERQEFVAVLGGKLRGQLASGIEVQCDTS